MNENLLDLASEWDSSLEAAGRAPRTRTNYRQAVESFARWCEATNHPATPGVMQRRTIEAWVRWQRANGSAPRTVLLRWKSLASFAGWLQTEDIIQMHPFYRLSAPAVPPEHKRVLTDGEITAIIAACSGADWDDRRDTLLLQILRDTGVRASELLGIQMGDVNPVTRSVLIRSSKTMPREVGLRAETVASYHRYLRSRARVPNRDLPALFLTRFGALTYNGFLDIFARRTALAGIRTNPHAFRHYAADAMLRSGMGVDAVARILGHTSLQMVTQVYAVALAGDRALEAHGRYLRG